MDILKIRNTGDKDLILPHDGLGTVTIPPNMERVLPASYALVFFGNPNTSGEDRVAEWNYSRRLWGFFGGMVPEAAWEGVAFSIADQEDVGPFAPSFECYDLEGNRVYMVLDDRDGSKAGTANAPALNPGASEDVLSRKLAEVEVMQRQLEAALAALQPATAVPVPATPQWWPEQGGAPGAPDLNDVVTLSNPANTEDPEKRVEQSSDLPKPAAKKVGKDSPQTTRIGRS